MSYCVNCGVELTDSEKHCPLCNVEVVNPNKPWVEPEQRPYSYHFETIAKRIDRRYFATLAGLIFLIPALVTVLSDLFSGGGITWSAYVVGALVMLYTFIFLPFLFKKYDVMLFLPLDFLTLLLYLLLIESVSGGNWFLGIGMPIVLSIGIVVFVLSVIFTKVKQAFLLKAGLCMIAVGIISVSIELILSLHYFNAVVFKWSYYVMIPLLILGVSAFILEHRKNFKESIKKRLFY